MLNKTVRPFAEFYRLFTSGMTRSELERFVKVDTRGMYAFYQRGMQQPAAGEKKWKRILIFCRNLFMAFLLKLTPARRLLYAVALMLFALALFNKDWWDAVYSIIILNFLLALELADKLITKDELEIAREIQLSLLPNRTAPIAGFEVATFSDAAKSVGGDYYDFVPLADGSVLVVIGDVSGKHLGGALHGESANHAANVCQGIRRSLRFAHALERPALPQPQAQLFSHHRAGAAFCHR